MKRQRSVSNANQPPKKRTKYRAAITRVPKPISSAPVKQVVKLRYANAFTISMNAGTPYYQVDFRGNDVYSPAGTFFTGNSANWFDIYASMYYEWQVKASSISIKTIDAVTYASATRISSALVPSSLPVTGVLATEDLMDYPMGKHKVNYHENAFRSYATTKDMLGHKLVNDNATIGLYNASPGQLWYWTYAIEYNGIADQNLRTYVVIDYVVEFFTPRPVNTEGQ